MAIALQNKLQTPLKPMASFFYKLNVDQQALFYMSDVAGFDSEV